MPLRILWNSLLVLLSTAVGVALVEGMLRVAPTPAFVAPGFPNIDAMQLDPVLGFRTRANLRGHRLDVSTLPARDAIDTNELGFRSPPVPANRPGVLRIVCLGDSGTLGLWVNEAMEVEVYGYPDALQQLVGPRADVINAGVLGYTTSHGLRQLLVRVLSLGPDVLTVRFGYNDHTPSWRPALLPREPESRLGRTLLYWLADLQILRFGLAVYRELDFLHEAPNQRPWVDLARFERNLQRFAQVARERKIRLLFMDYPLGPIGSVDQRSQLAAFMSGHKSIDALQRVHERYQAAVQRVAVRESVPLLKTARALSRVPPRAFSTVDVVHPNREGAMRLAALLASRFVALGWMAPRESDP